MKNPRLSHLLLLILPGSPLRRLLSWLAPNPKGGLLSAVVGGADRFRLCTAISATLSHRLQGKDKWKEVETGQERLGQAG